MYCYIHVPNRIRYLYEPRPSLGYGWAWLFDSMADNSPRHPKVVAFYQNIGFTQECIAADGLSIVAGYLKELDLITIQTYNDVATGGRERSVLAAMLMTSVEVRIRDNPDVYFTRFIEALRRSHLGNVADRLVHSCILLLQMSSAVLCGLLCLHTQ